VIRLAIFDLDGTLVDSKLDLCNAVNHALRTLRLPELALEEVSAFVGEGAARLIERAVAPRYDLKDRVLRAWFQYYEEHLLDETVLYPGLAALLARARIPLAVHTNKPGRLARRILSGLGVRHFFVEVVGGDEAARKPDPEGTRAILHRQRVPADEAVFVGDSLVDQATARAVPIPFVAVGWGLARPGLLRTAGAPEPVRNALELAAALGIEA